MSDSGLLWFSAAFFFLILYVFYKFMDDLGGTTHYKYQRPLCVSCKKRVEVVERLSDSRCMIVCNNKRCKSYGIQRNVNLKLKFVKHYSMSEERKLERRCKK